MSEEKRQLGRPSNRRKNNIKLHLKKREYDHVDWIHLAQDMDHEYGNETSDSMNYGKSFY
jgi:hypothetical protein